MLARIRQMLFGTTPDISAESRDFITRLAPQHIWLLVIGIRGTHAMPNVNRPAALEVVAANRIDVSEMGEDDSVFPFNYQRDGVQTLPFFSSKERVLAFRAESGFSADLLSLYQPYSLLSGFAATPENEVFDLVFDPRTNEERRLTRDERLLLRSLSKPS